MFLGMFAASILCAIGLENTSDINARWRKIISYTVGVLCLACAAVAASASLVLNLFKDQILSFLNNYFLTNLYHQTSGLPIEHYRQVILNYFNETLAIFDFRNPVFLFSLVFLIVSFAVIVLMHRGVEQVSKRTLATVVIFNLVLVLFQYLPTVSASIWPPASQTAALVDKNFRTMTFLAGSSEWAKLTVPHGTNLTESLRLNVEMLSPNTNLIYNIPHADEYENLMPRRIARLLALLGSDWATLGERLTEQNAGPEKKAEIFAERKYLLNVLGVRYITSLYPLPVFSKIAEHLATSHQIPVYIYENESAKPLAYFAEKIKQISPDEESAYQQLLVIKNADVVVWECEPCPEARPVEQGSAEVIMRKNDSFRLQTQASHAGLLVFSQNRLPGWKAYIDGRETAIYSVQSAFMGIVIPEGEHEVEFDFDYRNIFPL